MDPTAGNFYEFNSKTIVSRPGAEIRSIGDNRIGRFLERSEAIRQLNIGLDVYTVRKRDARDIADDVYMKDSGFHPPHAPDFFPHFHPGKEDHHWDKNREGRFRAYIGPGHVFFGSPGEGYDANRAKEEEMRKVKRDEDKRRKELNEVWGNRHDKSKPIS